MVRKCHGGTHTWDNCFPCFVEPQLFSFSLYLAKAPPSKSISDGDSSTRVILKNLAYLGREKSREVKDGLYHGPSLVLS